MSHFVTHESFIHERLHRDGRDLNEIVVVQIETPASIDGGVGWRCILRPDVYWPCAPLVGDTFMGRGEWRVAADEEIRDESDCCNWIVLERRLLYSGPSATTMSGILLLVVDHIDEPPWRERRMKATD